VDTVWPVRWVSIHLALDISIKAFVSFAAEKQKLPCFH
jgi:hypothetical protein